MLKGYPMGVPIGPQGLLEGVLLGPQGLLEGVLLGPQGLSYGGTYRQGWASQAIFRVESESFENTFESIRVELSVFPSRVKSSQIFFSLFHFLFISIESINKYFMTNYPVPSFYTQKK